MEFKRICKKLIFIPLRLIILFAIASAVLLIVVFSKGLSDCWFAYLIYVFAFYTFSAATVFCVISLPKKYSSAKQKIYDNKYGNRYLTDAVFRNRISLYRSLCVNLIYIAVNIFSGFRYNTRWFYILAGYYGILALMRFLLVRYMSKNAIKSNLLGEWKRSRICACVLTLINLSLSAVVLMMMYQDKGFVYNGILVYVMAMYAFYITTAAIVNIVRYRKYKSPIMTTAKIINLAAALVSMLALETAMLTAFGADTPIETKRILIALTGAGICAVVVAMSSYMIIRSNREIERIKENNSDE